MNEGIEKAFTALGAALLFSGLLVIAAPIQCALGALAGLTTEWFFGQPIQEVLGLFGLHVALSKLGATMGFLSSFLRTQTTVRAAR